MTTCNLPPCSGLAVVVLVTGVLLSSGNIPRPETLAPPLQPQPTATSMLCSH